MSYRGGLSVRDNWGEDYNIIPWGKIDAITIILTRFYTIMFIISIIVSIISLFTLNKMAKKVESFRGK